MTSVQCSFAVQGGEGEEFKIRVARGSTTDDVKAQILTRLRPRIVAFSDLGFEDAEGFDVHSERLVAAIASASCCTHPPPPTTDVDPFVHLSELVGSDCWVDGHCSINMKVGIPGAPPLQQQPALLATALDAGLPQQPPPQLQAAVRQDMSPSLG